MNFMTGAELLKLCEENKKTISEIMQERETAVSGMAASEAHDLMFHSFSVMRDAAREAVIHERRSMGGLIGGEARKMDAYLREARPLCGSLLSKAGMYALGVLEVNASMGLIVAAPTAGASGVIPGVLLAMQEEEGYSDEKMVKALFNASAVGYLLMQNATVAGAEGGCQAEVGSASAMAASAAVELRGGSPQQCLDAAGTALSNVMGLVCDPVGGLVEVPCQKRNAMGAANALMCADITLAGIGSLIPFDEVVSAMYQVGRSLPFELRETALGGHAATPTARRLCADCGKCPTV